MKLPSAALAVGWGLLNGVDGHTHVETAR